MAGIRPLLCVVLAVTTVAACSYDWTVDHAASAVDADVMTQPDVEVPEAGEAGGHDASVVDSGMAPKDTGAPHSDGAPDCAALTQQLLAARNQAIQCVETASACMTTVTDECGCEVAVGGNAGAESGFTSAVMAFKEAGCSTTSLCPGTCTIPMHVCLAMEGGAIYTCYQ
jgi:hypothetical protein